MASDQKLAERIMNHLNGCADDVFEHDIRFLSMRQEGKVFSGTVEDKTVGTGPTPFTFQWTKPLKTEDDISALTMHMINTIIADYSDSDESDDSDD